MFGEKPNTSLSRGSICWNIMMWIVQSGSEWEEKKWRGLKDISWPYILKNLSLIRLRSGIFINCNVSFYFRQRLVFNNELVY